MSDEGRNPYEKPALTVKQVRRRLEVIAVVAGLGALAGLWIFIDGATTASEFCNALGCFDRTDVKQQNMFLGAVMMIVAGLTCAWAVRSNRSRE